MSVSVRIPTTLRTLTGGQSQVALEGSDVRAVLASLDGAHPGFADRLLDDDGNLRRFVNVFVADDDIRFLKGSTRRCPTARRCRSSRPWPAAEPALPGPSR